MVRHPARDLVERETLAFSFKSFARDCLPLDDVSDLAIPRSAVVKPREQLLDAEVMATAADLGVEMAKKMGGLGAITPAQFMARLCKQFVVGVDPDAQAERDEGAFNWTLFGSSVGKHFHAAPTMAFM